MLQCIYRVRASKVMIEMDLNHLSEHRVDEDILLKLDYCIADPETIPTPKSNFSKSGQ